MAERPRFEILNDGPDRWVLIDNENDDPAPVYETKEAAERAAAAHESEKEADANEVDI